MQCAASTFRALSSATEAHARLARELPAEHFYHKTLRQGMCAALKALWQECRASKNTERTTGELLAAEARRERAATMGDSRRKLNI